MNNKSFKRWANYLLSCFMSLASKPFAVTYLVLYLSLLGKRVTFRGIYYCAPSANPWVYIAICCCNSNEILLSVPPITWLYGLSKLCLWDAELRGVQLLHLPHNTTKHFINFQWVSVNLHCIGTSRKMFAPLVCTSTSHLFFLWISTVLFPSWCKSKRH